MSSRSGLDADDRVVVNGLMRVRAGQKVTPQAAGAPRRAGRSRRRAARRSSAAHADFAFLHRPADLRFGGLRSSSSFSAASRFTRLPVAQYPEIAPPIINVTGQYPGASAETVAETVVAPIEQQINGVEGMLYISSNSTADGRFSIAVTFDIGTNLDIAQVQVQNRVAHRAAAPAAGGAADRRDGAPRARPTF